MVLYAYATPFDCADVNINVECHCNSKNIGDEETPCLALASYHKSYGLHAHLDVRGPLWTFSAPQGFPVNKVLRAPSSHPKFIGSEQPETLLEMSSPFQRTRQRKLPDFACQRSKTRREAKGGLAIVASPQTAGAPPRRAPRAAVSAGPSLLSTAKGLRP